VSSRSRRAGTNPELETRNPQRESMKVIDIHTHGIGGFDTTSASVDAILRIAEIHGASGVSEIVLSIYSAPIPIMRRQMELVRKAMERQGHGARVTGQG